MLEPFGDGLWTADSTLRMPGMSLGVRMSVLRHGGGLLVYSPVALDDALVAQVDALGAVTDIVAPNQHHHLHLAGARVRWPQARLWAAPGLERKRRDLAFHGVLTAQTRAPWEDELPTLRVAGMPRHSEVLILHRPSRTLVVADFLFNVTQVQGWAARLFWRLNGGLGPRQTRIFRSFVRDRAAFSATARRVVELDFDHVVLSHGEVLRGGAKEVIHRALAWGTGIGQAGEDGDGGAG